MAHISVLMDQVIESLDIQETDVIVDGTMNGGGHSFEIASRLSKKGVLVGIDLDASAIAVSQEKLTGLKPAIHFAHNNFRNIDTILAELKFSSCDKILLDLGWSSNQFENPERGFSFMHDGPLLMTLSDDPSRVIFTAEDIVNNWQEESLIDILESYGEEKYAWKIVQAILSYRENKKIVSTLELADIVKNAVPVKYRQAKIHPATKTFQALRIAVNDEMGALHEVLEKGFELLSPGGRMVIITFHSIEDRIVKRFFKKKKERLLGTLLTKKPQTANEKELLENRRARSAKLRVLIKNEI